MGRILSYLAVSAGLLVFCLYAYYGTIDPCGILTHERSGLLERVFTKDPESMTRQECAARLPDKWWEAFLSFWEDRPAVEEPDQ